MATKSIGALHEARARAYFEAPSRYLRSNRRIALRREIVLRLVGDVKGARVLDMGCGNGAISAAFLPGNHVTMLDNSPGMLDLARQHGGECVHGSATGFHDEEGYDLILAIGLLAHVPETDPVMASIARNLRPGGRCVVQFSDYHRTVNKASDALFRLKRWLIPGAIRPRPMTRGSVLRAAEWHGLEPAAEVSHLLVLPGMPRLLGPLLTPYDRFVSRRPWLARHGLDTLMLLKHPSPA